MRLGLSIGASLIALAAAAGVGGAARADDLTCTVASIQSAAPPGATVTAAVHLDQPVPHCRVDGFSVTTSPAPSPGDGKALWRLQLPDKAFWKGRYYFIGLGGAAGYVPTDSQIPSGNPMVKGFAVAGTDTGHEGSGLDYTFLSDPVKALDHTKRAAHVTAVATQQITRAYYGATRIWRYHAGCSGGGRMGGEAITNYPEDYDGVLLGQSRVSPRPNSALGMMKFIQAIQEMNREPGAWLSPAKLEMVDARVTAACDMTDGARDGVVWDHRLCHYDVGQLRCVSGDKPDCLTEPQIRSIKAILAGPHGPDGALLDTPMPITNMSVWSMFLGATPPPWSPNETDMRKTAAAYPLANTHGRGMYGPSYDFLRDFSFSRQSDIDSWEANALKSGFWGSPDLTPFARTGGKAILWVGASDPCCSNVDMEAYVRKLGATMTPGRVAEFIQLYEIPGTGHCGGGTGPGDASDRLLDALVDWVENGKIPGPVTMHRGADRVQLQFAASGPSESGVLVPPPAEVSRDFLVCPYPTVSVFDRRKANVPGAVYDGANWSCRASRD